VFKKEIIGKVCNIFKGSYPANRSCKKCIIGPSEADSALLIDSYQNILSILVWDNAENFPCLMQPEISQLIIIFFTGPMDGSIDSQHTSVVHQE
jgi:hypothetical protein